MDAVFRSRSHNLKKGGAGARINKSQLEPRAGPNTPGSNTQRFKFQSKTCLELDSLAHFGLKTLKYLYIYWKF